MARRTARPVPDRLVALTTLTTSCPHCGRPLWAAYTNRRTVVMRDGAVRLAIQVRRCRDRSRPLSCRPLRPEAEGTIALPGHEFGLDLIALVGALRYAEHHNLPEIHRALTGRGVAICLRSVGILLDRYDELLALSPADTARLRRVTVMTGYVVLGLHG